MKTFMFFVWICMHKLLMLPKMQLPLYFIVVFLSVGSRFSHNRISCTILAVDLLDEFGESHRIRQAIRFDLLCYYLIPRYDSISSKTSSLSRLPTLFFLRRLTLFTGKIEK